MTAVDWFIDKITDSGHLWMTDKPSDMLELSQYIEKAKQMENEQRNEDLKTGYNQGYIDAQCNHINDADNFTHEYLNH